MRNYVLVFLTSLLFLVITSCCTKKECIGADEIYRISFYNFSESDLDTIIILSYTKNSNFSTLIDSTVIAASKSVDHYSAYTNSRIQTELDYKINLISTGEIFTLTDFEIIKEGCNSCFPYWPEDDFYNKLNGYKVNGQPQTGTQIKIYK